MILQDFSKQIILLIISLTITPSIIFLGNNYLLTEFFTINFFYFIFCYNLIFVAIAFIVNYFFNKKILLIVLFFAYFNFIQFYFVDFQNVLKIYKDGHTDILCFVFYLIFMPNFNFLF